MLKVILSRIYCKKYLNSHSEVLTAIHSFDIVSDDYDLLDDFFIEFNTVFSMSDVSVTRDGRYKRTAELKGEFDKLFLPKLYLKLKEFNEGYDTPCEAELVINPSLISVGNGSSTFDHGVKDTFCVGALSILSDLSNNLGDAVVCFKGSAIRRRTCDHWWVDEGLIIAIYRRD